MRNPLPHILLSLLLLAGFACQGGRESLAPFWAKIDSIMPTRPDSALRLLRDKANERFTKADRARYGDIHAFEARPPEAGQGLFNISAVPWTSFRSLHLELPEANDYLLPIFTLGRYREENGRTLLPLAVQVHHGVTDGFHVGRFFSRLQAWADGAAEAGT